MAETKPAENFSQKLWRLTRELAPLVFILLLVRCVVIEPYRIPSGSLIPTLLVGDNIVISKFTYGISKYSFFFGRYINYFSGRKFEMSEVQRGDVAVFVNPTYDPKFYYLIKRIVGLPGDTIQMREGKLYVNGEPLKISEVQKNYSEEEGDGDIANGVLFEEIVPSADEGALGKKHLILRKDLAGVSPQNNTEVYRVPDGHYFGMGDNRDGSTDSRFLTKVGFIPKENLVGPALFVMYSVTPDFSWFKPWLWPWRIRYSRFFKKIV